MAYIVKGEIKKVNRFNNPFSEVFFTCLTMEEQAGAYRVGIYKVTDKIQEENAWERLPIGDALLKFDEQRTRLINLGYKPRK